MPRVPPPLTTPCKLRQGRQHKTLPTEIPLLCLLILLLGLAGCQTARPPEPTPPAPPVQPQTQPTPAISAKAERIDALLSQGNLALASRHLTTPDDNNAYLRFMQVLSLDPDNDAALQGLAAIVDLYLTWSINHIDAGNLRQARHFLMTARSVDPDHPNIAPVETRLDARRSASLVDYTLDLPASGEPGPRTLAQLSRIAEQAARDHAAVVIFAPTDTQGRQIYQRLNAATHERIRARFELSTRPRVRLIIPAQTP